MTAQARDLLAAVLFFVLGAVFYANLEMFTHGPQQFPRAISLLTMAGAVWLGVRSLRTAGGVDMDIQTRAEQGIKAFYYTTAIALTVLYVVSLSFLGFLIASTALILLMASALKYRYALIAVAIALTTSIVFILFFERVVVSPLPKGIFGSYFRMVGL